MMPLPHRWPVLALALLQLAALPGAARADGELTGQVYVPRLLGQPSAGRHHLYEANIFVSPADATVVGPSRRLGAPPGKPPSYDGFYSVTLPAGTYSTLVSQPEFFIRPKVVAPITVVDGPAQTLDIALALDFAVYTKAANEWTEADGGFYQTFVAQGTSLSGVSFILAGTQTDHVEVALLRHDPAAADVRGWTQVAARKTKVAVSADNWVRWRSGEAPMVPGTKYAIRLTGQDGGYAFQVFKRDKDSQSYAQGRAYRSSGAAQSYDLSLLVFADNDGTRVTLNKRTPGLGQLAGDPSPSWSQSFVAHGTSLAGADLWAIGGKDGWDDVSSWTVHAGGPTGPQVGPTKRTRSAWPGLRGVSYAPGEVPLTAGQTYVIKVAGAQFADAYLSDDPFAEGQAYRDGTARPGDDLSMTILEHTTPLPCTSDADCQPGESCDPASGNCLPSATPDAGVDGSAPTVDSGAPLDGAPPADLAGNAALADGGATTVDAAGAANQPSRTLGGGCSIAASPLAPAWPTGTIWLLLALALGRWRRHPR